jgi:predicted dehydrogenase
MKSKSITRRAFLASTTSAVTLAALGFAPRLNAARVVPRKLSPNEKLNVAGIGVGGKGVGDVMNCNQENIVALCDADWERAGETFYRCKGAKQFWDYRKMLEEMGDEIDAVTISTPDHMHAPAAYRAIKMAKHVYVQKPLTHTIAEARLLGAAAKEMGVTTQMGNQGCSMNAHRDLKEVVETGVLGQTHTVHTWTDRPAVKWPQGIPNILPEQPVRDKLNWDLWIGGAPMRAYNEGYCPRKWRGWWDFGCGALGDMGCHNMNPAWDALRLYEAKTITVHCTQEDGLNDQTGPHSSIIRYDFPQRGDLGPVTFYWYDGSLMPKMPDGINEKDLYLGNGSLLEGSKAALTCGVFGDKPKLLTGEAKDDFKAPAPSYERIREENHHWDWIESIKSGTAGTSDFSKAVPLTEMVLLGNIALRTGSPFTFDTKTGTIADNPKASALLSKDYRKGWELPV